MSNNQSASTNSSEKPSEAEHSTPNNASTGKQESNKSTNGSSSTPVTTASSQASTAHTGIPTGLSGAQILNYIHEMDGNLLKIARKQAKMEGQDMKEHKFWNTQPVPQKEELVVENGPIEIKTIDDVRKEPYNMPVGFEWGIVDVNNPEEMSEMYTLLSENYVEDDDCQFRFDYSIPFLHWALTPPGYVMDWHVAVRNSKNKKLMGCITGIPAHIKVADIVTPMVEINFLCVHKKLRDKRLAPVLIKEITRRVNLRDVWQATYTAGVVLPKPVARCRYYHRSLNPKKLIEVRFSYLPARMTMANHIRTLKVKTTTHHNWVALRPEHVPSAHALLMEYLDSKTKLRVVYSLEEFHHVFLPRDNVINTYVLESLSSPGTVTDMLSFYHLPSTIIGNPVHSKLFAVYSYYNVATTVPFVDLMSDALILAAAAGVDVFNALDAMENLSIMEPLKFGIGDGYLQYYLYNWKHPEMPARDVGLILL